MISARDDYQLVGFNSVDQPVDFINSVSLYYSVDSVRQDWSDPILSGRTMHNSRQTCALCDLTPYYTYYITLILKLFILSPDRGATDLKLTFVLVHGSMHEGSCWDEVSAELSRQGHVAYAPTNSRSPNWLMASLI